MAKVQLEELVVTISADNKKLVSVLNSTTKVTEDAMKNASSAMSSMVGKSDKDTDKLGQTFTKLGGVIESQLSGRGSAAAGMLSEVLSSQLTVALGATAAAAAVAAAALKTWLDLTLAAERNEQISRSFDALAESAGLAGDALKEGLIAASNGLADDDAILQSANRAIVQLGDNARVIPQTMELARKATALFGGDLVSNFEAFNDAIATGNVRLLKQFGIVIDAEEAEKKYAASIGMTGEKLNEAGRKQAIMNATLEQASVKLKDVDETSIEATASLSRLGVALGNIGDSVADAARSSGFFSSILDSLTDAAEGVALVISDKFGAGADDLRARLRKAQGGISDFSAELAYLKSRMDDSASPWEKGTLILAINKATDGLTNAKREFAEIRAQIDAAEAEAAARAASQGAGDQSKDEQIKAAMLAEQRKKAAEEELKERKQMAEEGKRLAEDAILQMEEDTAIRLALLEERRASEKEAAAVAYAEDLISKDEFEAAMAALDEKYIAEEKDRRDKRNKEILKKEKELQDEEKERHKKLLQDREQTLDNLAQLQNSSSKEMAAMGKAAALTQIGISTHEGAIKAYSSLAGIPLVGPALGATAAAALIAYGTERAVKVAGFNKGGTVPGIGFKDTVPAVLTPGEEIVDKSTSKALRSFLSGNGGMGGAEEITIRHMFEFNVDRLAEVIESKIVERRRLGISQLESA